MKKLTLLVLIVALVVAFFAFDLGRFLTLDALKSGQATFAVWYGASPWLVAGGYFVPEREATFVTTASPL